MSVCGIGTDLPPSFLSDILDNSTMTHSLSNDSIHSNLAYANNDSHISCRSTGVNMTNKSMKQIISPQAAGGNNFDYFSSNVITTETSKTVHLSKSNTISSTNRQSNFHNFISNDNLIDNYIQHDRSNFQVLKVPSLKKTEQFKCEWNLCEIIFSDLMDLVQHIHHIHIKSETNSISVTGNVYVCHWRNCHRNQKPFDTKYKIVNHLRSHTNEKPFICTLCSKKFTRAEPLTVHMRSHTGEKPYACSHTGCSKVFTNTSDRLKHARTHIDDKPYVCKTEGCGKKYTDPSSLRKHIRRYKHFYRKEDLNGEINTKVNPLVDLNNSESKAFTSFTSNPLLSSTVITSGNSSDNASSNQIMEHCFTPFDNLESNLNDAKCQDVPLDLTTGPLCLKLFH